MSQRIVEVSREYDRSKGFLFGLYVGLLSLLILVSLFDPLYLPQNLPDLKENYTFKIPNLHAATNIYGMLALAGAVLGFWRIWKWADKPRRLLHLPSVWICSGLAVWVIAQGLWVLGVRPWIRDTAFIVADLCWLAALWTILKLVNKLLNGLGKPEIKFSPFMGLLTTILGLLIAVFLWINRSLIDAAELTSATFFQLGTDFVYMLFTFAGIVLAVALVNAKTAELPLPVQRCLRYVFAATVINAFATLAFVLTTKFNAGDPGFYSDGNWIDWLFLTAMYCWGISALTCPIREAEHQYTYSATLDNVSLEDYYRAREITEHYLRTEPNSKRTIYLDSTRWILDNIPGCWNIVKLGELVVGSTFLFPVSRALIKRFRAHEITEREMFEEVMKNPLTWECLYLADASILARHRRRRLAFNCFKETIDWVKEEHKDLEIEVHCWPNTLERDGLVEELVKHFKGKVKVLRVPGALKDRIGGRL